MESTPEQISAFGTDARRRRKRLELRAEDVAARLTERLGRPYSHQSVTAWERGNYPPRDLATVVALDEILCADGELAELLVGVPMSSSTSERFAEMEARLAALEVEVFGSKLVRLRQRAAREPGDFVTAAEGGKPPTKRSRNTTRRPIDAPEQED